MQSTISNTRRYSIASNSSVPPRVTRARSFPSACLIRGVERAVFGENFSTDLRRVLDRRAQRPNQAVSLSTASLTMAPSSMKASKSEGLRKYRVTCRSAT
ncbi:MAG: hypothetical protein JWN34_609 [Bryobacterales bacterium]|nr:hypothetical protein [Bryobacterales bacterium]